jgi:rod shape-determining protein MreC
MQTLFAFLRKHHFLTLFLILELVAFSMLIHSYSYQRTLSFNAASDLSGGLFNVLSNTTNYLRLQAQNEQLLEENTKLHNRLANCVSVADTNEMPGDTVFRYFSAHVIRNTTHASNNFMMLDKGRLQGVEKEMGVISDHGVAGIVIGVSDHYALVMSLMNDNAKISARIKKNQQLANVIWEPDYPKQGKLIDIPVHLQLLQGDTVVTSGNSFIFPAGLVIGFIESYSPNEKKGLNTAQLRFATDFNQLNHVYLIKNLRKQEEKTLLKETEDE